MKKALIYLILMGWGGGLMAQGTSPLSLWTYTESRIFNDTLLFNDTMMARLSRIYERVPLQDVSVVWVDGSALQDSIVRLEMPDGQLVSLQRRGLRRLRNGSWRWQGSSPSFPEFITTFTGRSQRLLGRIELPQSSWRLRPLGRGFHALFPWTESPDEACGTEPHEEPAERKAPDHEQTPDVASLLVPDISIECNLRVLVGYTVTVAKKVGFDNMQDFVLDLVEYANDSYANSLVGFRMELARSVQLDYVESNTFDCSTPFGCKSLDLIRFQEDGDGFMDEIHKLRGLYDADLCILLTDSVVTGSGGAPKVIGGQALTILANDKSEGFAILKYTKHESAFPHEFGHLQGCRHDIGADNTLSPFIMGHGFVDLSAGWRTVMAYQTGCDSATPCPRIPYFSNLRTTFNGDVMGDAFSDNATVLDATYGDMAAFEETKDEKNLASVDEVLITGWDMADVYAHERINAAENFAFTIENDASVSFRAGEQIELMPGFSVEAGSTFEALLEEDGCENAIGVAQFRTAALEAEPTPEPALAPPRFHAFTLFPNPAEHRATLSFELTEASLVRMQLMDMQGRSLPVGTRQAQLEAGRHDWTFEVGALPAGLYHCVLDAEGERQSKRLVVK